MIHVIKISKKIQKMKINLTILKNSLKLKFLRKIKKKVKKTHVKKLINLIIYDQKVSKEKITEETLQMWIDQDHCMMELASNRLLRKFTSPGIP